MSSPSQLIKLKVADLRAQLESRGLDSKGIKATLVTRLQDALDADDKDETADTAAVAPLPNMKMKILEDVAAETDSPAGSRPGTPTRKSRRVSGNFAEERPETPTRKSRRLSETVTEEARPETPTRKSRRVSGNFAAETDSPAGSRPGTPTRKSRRVSGNFAEERPETPTRKSRRLSGGFEPTEERPLTPSRKSRRLSGAGEDDKPEIVKSLLLEDQLSGLGSPSRRTSATARNKRISQLGGSAITTIPEIPEKEATIEATIVEETEPAAEVIEEKLTEIKEKVDEVKTVKKIKEESVIKSAAEGRGNTPLTPITKKLERIIVAIHIPRQKPKSGKFWKEGRQQFRQIKRDRGQRFTFEQRVKNKEEKMKNKEMAELLLNRKNTKKEEMRKKIEENKAKKLENEKKSERFQVIKNPAKIKRMKKKQLRMLEKRDLVTV